jgi:hypothetical protein
MECMAASALLCHPARLSQDGRIHRQLLNMAILWALWSAWQPVLPAASCPAQSGWPSPQTTPKHGNPAGSMECMAASALLRHPARLCQDGRLHRQLLNMSILGFMEYNVASALLRHPVRLSQDGRLSRQLLNMAILWALWSTRR